MSDTFNAEEHEWTVGDGWRETVRSQAAVEERLQASGWKPCGHEALGCSNGIRPCCIDCDHGTYWRALHATEPEGSR